MNTPKEMQELYEKHAIEWTHGDLCIKGYADMDPSDGICFMVQNDGQFHFLDYGITKNSVLFADKNAPLEDGDLVVVLDNGKPSVQLFRDQGHSQELQDGDAVPTITAPTRAYAKVLGSFIFFK
jgi:SOS-response transcriptional repressor LexA